MSRNPDPVKALAAYRKLPEVEKRLVASLLDEAQLAALSKALESEGNKEDQIERLEDVECSSWLRNLLRKRLLETGHEVDALTPMARRALQDVLTGMRVSEAKP
jgi:hypothetical protein